MTTRPLHTYQVTSSYQAMVFEKPAGKKIRNLVLDETFQGRRSTYKGWIERIDDDGTTVTGFIRASLVRRLDVPWVPTEETPPPPPAQLDSDPLGDALSQVIVELSRGRSIPSRQRLHSGLADFAAELIGRATSQSASVLAGMLERQRDQEQRIAALLLEVERLKDERERERAVGA